MIIAHNEAGCIPYFDKAVGRHSIIGITDFKKVMPYYNTVRFPYTYRNTTLTEYKTVVLNRDIPMYGCVEPLYLWPDSNHRRAAFKECIAAYREVAHRP